MIPVTKTFFPPLEEYQINLQKIWKNQWLTNRGELVRDLEMKLKSEFEVPYLTLTANGTLPLQISLKVLADGGEVITTPFSYVATTAAIHWENCQPVFVDIDPNHLTIDEKKIKAAITSKTRVILATHVFGNPCNVEVIEKIAKKYNLKVIYDAAHSFGVKYRGKNIFQYGDVSTCSFHATKLFHAGEGGAMISHDEQLHQTLYYHHNFGHKGQMEFYGLGINAKMSELQAAMGLTVLPHMQEIFEARSKVTQFYNEHLEFHKIKKMTVREGTQWNYSYYPVIFESEESLLEKQKLLNDHHIFPRRYFYPSLNTLPYSKRISMPVSESISSRIMCLPLYHSIEHDSLTQIVELLNQ